MTATMPAWLKKREIPERPERRAAAVGTRARGERDRFQLRALPYEGVYFHCKKVDNKRLVRDLDPKAGARCWSAIMALFLAFLVTGWVLAPKAAITMRGYRLESLRAEERRLLDERRVLDLQEAELLSPGRLETLAHRQNLVTPQTGQVVRLDGNTPDSSVAMVK